MKCACYPSILNHIPIHDLAVVIYDYMRTNTGAPYRIKMYGHFTFTLGWHYSEICFHSNVPNNKYTLMIESFVNHIDKTLFKPQYHQILYDRALMLDHKYMRNNGCKFWKVRRRNALKSEFMKAMSKIYEIMNSDHEIMNSGHEHIDPRIELTRREYCFPIG